MPVSTIAKQFIHDIESSLKAHGYVATVQDWSVHAPTTDRSGFRDYRPDQLDLIPQRCVFSVSAIAQIGDMQLKFYYDGKEDSVAVSNNRVGEFPNVKSAVDKCHELGVLPQD